MCVETLPVYTTVLLHGGHQDRLRLARERAVPASLVTCVPACVHYGRNENATGDRLGY